MHHKQYAYQNMISSVISSAYIGQAGTDACILWRERGPFIRAVRGLTNIGTVCTISCHAQFSVTTWHLDSIWTVYALELSIIAWIHVALCWYICVIHTVHYSVMHTIIITFKLFQYIYNHLINFNAVIWDKLIFFWFWPDEDNVKSTMLYHSVGSWETRSRG